MLSAHQNKMVKKKGFFQTKKERKTDSGEDQELVTPPGPVYSDEGPLRDVYCARPTLHWASPVPSNFVRIFSRTPRAHSRDRSPRASWMRRLARLVRRLVSNGSVESIHTHHQFEKKIIISSVCHRPLVPTPGSEKIPLLPIWLYTSW
jgi:hypothetical protein